MINVALPLSTSRMTAALLFSQYSLSALNPSLNRQICDIFFQTADARQHILCYLHVECEVQDALACPIRFMNSFIFYLSSAKPMQKLILSLSWRL